MSQNTSYNWKTYSSLLGINIPPSTLGKNGPEYSTDTFLYEFGKIDQFWKFQTLSVTKLSYFFEIGRFLQEKPLILGHKYYKILKRKSKGIFPNQK